MPRLITIEMKKSFAISCLMELYEKEDNFLTSWRRLRDASTTTKILKELATTDILLDIDLINNNFLLDPYESELARQRILEYMLPKIPSDNIWTRAFINNLQNHRKELISRLESYGEELGVLASQWHLKTDWVPKVFLERDVNYFNNLILKDAKLDFVIEVQKKYIKSRYSEFTLSFPSLEIIVPGSAFNSKDKMEILGQIKELVDDHEEHLKLLGAKIFPTELKTYARYWFEHYVHNRKYFDLTGENIGGESVKRKVWEFRKLLNIKL